MAESVPTGAAADLMPPPATPADEARAQIAALKNDAAWVKRHTDGDPATAEQLRRLHELAFQPTANSIISGAPTPQAQWEETAAHLETVGELSAAVIEEIRQGRPASAEDYRLARARKSARMSDPAWVGRYMNNGSDERREMLLLNSIISRGMRLGA